MAIAVKVYIHHPLGLRPSVHRLELSEPYVLSELAEKVERFAEGSTIGNLRWRDAEKDMITLTSDEDLVLAIDHVRSENIDLLRVHADVEFGVSHSVDPGKAVRSETEVAEQSEADRCGGDHVEDMSGGEVAGQSTRREVGQAKKKKWPVRELPSGGRYSGYVRVTGADSKSVERELTLEEATELLGSPSVFGGFEGMFSWRRFQQRRVLPLAGYSHPLFLPFYF